MTSGTIPSSLKTWGQSARGVFLMNPSGLMVRTSLETMPSFAVRLILAAFLKNSWLFTSPHSASGDSTRMISHTSSSWSPITTISYFPSLSVTASLVSVTVWFSRPLHSSFTFAPEEHTQTTYVRRYIILWN